MPFNIVLILFLLLSCSPAFASFDRLLDAVSGESGVPKHTLKAVCTHESESYYKGKRQPWPWTLNVGGKGIWFKSRSAAVAYAELELLGGTNPVKLDVGMCQINWFWHREKFNSINSLINPAANIRYAAKYRKNIKRGNR